MDYKFLTFVKTNGLTTLSLNRPEKHNALNGLFIKELLVALKEVAQNDSLVLLINGHGASFCAGGDIAWMKKIANAPMTENYDDAQMLSDLLYQLYIFPKPTIVLAHGSILGGGLGLVAAADIAIASDDAQFALPEVKIGLTPSIISPYVIEAIGSRFAHYYFLTGERFGTDTAYRLGLVQQVAEKEALMSTGLVVAETLMGNGPKALKEAKQLIRFVRRTNSESLAQKTAEHLAEMRRGDEAQEGLRAFLEKRKPRWRSVKQGE